jgi:hypothetical protein
LLFDAPRRFGRRWWEQTAPAVSYSALRAIVHPKHGGVTCAGRRLKETWYADDADNADNADKTAEPDPRKSA